VILDAYSFLLNKFEGTLECNTFNIPALAIKTNRQCFIALAPPHGQPASDAQ
jgi:hypothetical protein